jgi:hypothetical protein
MPDENKSQLNPQIASATIGIRNLREIEIFPLSVGDQLSMTSVINEALVAFGDSVEDVEMAGVAVQLLTQNIPLILGFVIDDEKEDIDVLLKDLTNEQAASIAEIVYEQNYKSLLAKVQGLIEKVKKQMEELPSKRPSLPSVKSMDTDLEISTGQDSETADSQ